MDCLLEELIHNNPTNSISKNSNKKQKNGKKNIYWIKWQHLDQYGHLNNLKLNRQYHPLNISKKKMIQFFHHHHQKLIHNFCHHSDKGSRVMTILCNLQNSLRLVSWTEWKNWKRPINEFFRQNPKNKNRKNWIFLKLYPNSLSLQISRKCQH